MVLSYGILSGVSLYMLYKLSRTLNEKDFHHVWKVYLVSAFIQIACALTM